MYQQRLFALSERLDKLERALRLWKALGILALAGLGLLVAVALSAPVLRAARAEEARELEIAVPPEVFSPAGAQPSELVRARRVVLEDRDGRVRGAFRVSEAGSPHLELFGPSGRTLASLSVKGGGTASIVLYDRMGRVLWRAP